MQIQLNLNDDILFDLEQVRLLSQRRVVLNHAQKQAVRSLPLACRAAEKERLIAERTAAKKVYIRQWLDKIEEKVRLSDLPADLVNRILSMTTAIKNRGMTFTYDAEKVLTQLEVDVRQAEQAKREASAPQTTPQDIMAAAAPAVLLAPFVHVRFNAQEYDKRLDTYVADKILPQLGTGTVKPLPLRKPDPVKPGSLYSKKHYMAQAKKESDLHQALIKQVQESAHAAGKPVPEASAILNDYKALAPVRKRWLERKIYKDNPKLKERHDQMAKIIAAREIAKGAARLRRKHAQKEARRANRLQRQLRLAQQKRPNRTGLNNKLSRLSHRRPRPIDTLGKDRPLSHTQKTKALPRDLLARHTRVKTVA